MNKTIIASNIRQTQKIAKDLANQCPKFDLGQQAMVIGLAGELGSGKTSFVQGFAKGLGIKGRVISPTFVIQKKFQIPRNKLLQTNSKFLPDFVKRRSFWRAGKIQKFKTLIHIDAYRIKNPKEILDLGWKEMVENPKNIIIIEWSERIKKILPSGCIWIQFEHKDKSKRCIKIKKH